MFEASVGGFRLRYKILRKIAKDRNKFVVEILRSVIYLTISINNFSSNGEKIREILLLITKLLLSVSMIMKRVLTSWVEMPEPTSPCGIGSNAVEGQTILYKRKIKQMGHGQ